MSKITVDQEECIGCEACIDSCPQSVLTMSGDKATVTAEDECIECGACVDECPVGALTL